MSKSLIRKNQLHPDISDLVGEYGSGYFITSGDLANYQFTVSATGENIIYTTGNQTISGIKNFVERPTVNGSGVLLQNEESVGEYIFTGDLQVNLSNGKTFGKYQNGQTIPSSGKTTSEIIKLAIFEAIDPTVNLSVSPVSILIGQTNISNTLTFSNVINNPGATSSFSLEWKRNFSDTSWTAFTNPTSPFIHSFTDPSSNNNNISYRYIVTDSFGSSATGNASVSFLYGNYFGYSSATSLTTVTEIEALGNELLSNGKSRTIVATTPNNQSFTYYAYNSTAGNLNSIIQNSAAPVLGAFQNQGIISGPNKNGVNVSYIVYKSVDPGAFSSDTLAFS